MHFSEISILTKKKTLGKNTLQFYPRILVVFILYTLKGNVVFWCFFMSEKSKKNLKSHFCSPNLSVEPNFFQCDGKVTPFHRIWRKY